MITELIRGKKEEFELALEHFRTEAAKLRTGRAHPGLVENLPVDYYGTKTPLRQIASVNVPEARQLLIQPWDKNALGAVETAIRTSDIGLNPANDGSAIRIILPPLTEDRRRELVRTLNQRAEEGRIALRAIREDLAQAIQKMAQAGEIGEDDKFRGKEELQRAIDGYNAELEKVREKKEEEILTV
jgi:ribosome recycling factor